MDWLTKSNFMRESMPKTKIRNTRVFGVGVNDADYVVDPSKLSGLGACPAYKAWSRIMQRAYSEAWAKRNPTYHAVTVHRDWHRFSAFRSWWVDNVVHGWEIDKDLLTLGNTEYGPDTCVFIPKWLNVISNENKSVRGEFPIGVYYHKQVQRYRAQINLGTGSQKYLGDFSSPTEAHNAWLRAKVDYINSRRNEIAAIDPRIYENLLTKIKRA